MESQYATVQVVAGVPAAGLWCDRCLLPSALEFKLHGLDPGDTAGPLAVVVAARGRERELDAAIADVGDPQMGGVVAVGTLWVCDSCEQARMTCADCGRARPVPFDQWFVADDD